MGYKARLYGKVERSYAFDDAMYEDMKATACRLNMTVSVLVRMAVAQFLERYHNDNAVYLDGKKHK